MEHGDWWVDDVHRTTIGAEQRGGDQLGPLGRCAHPVTVVLVAAAAVVGEGRQGQQPSTVELTHHLQRFATRLGDQRPRITVEVDEWDRGTGGVTQQPALSRDGQVRTGIPAITTGSRLAHGSSASSAAS